MKFSNTTCVILAQKLTRAQKERRKKEAEEVAAARSTDGLRLGAQCWGPVTPFLQGTPGPQADLPATATSAPLPCMLSPTVPNKYLPPHSSVPALGPLTPPPMPGSFPVSSAFGPVVRPLGTLWNQAITQGYPSPCTMHLP